jgi:branched-chain amino acid transport system substrate-binding protein
MKNFHPRMLMMVSVLAFTILLSAFAMAAPPIKVGLLAPLSGPYAMQGIFMKNGTALAFEQAGDIAGRKVEIIVEDTEMKPDVGVTKWRKLVEKLILAQLDWL